MKHPKAITQGTIARPLESGLLVVGPGHTYQQLDALCAWVWQHADGESDVDLLAAGLRAEVDPAADRVVVFEALDRLADAGLLEGRIAPPAGTSRRVMLRRLGGAAALAALTAVVGLPGVAQAAKGSCSDEKALLSEIAWLEAEQATVAELLDDWLDEAEKDDTSSEVYLAELNKRERTYKHRAHAYGAKLDDAGQDLTECNLEGKQANLTKREKRRKQHFAKREKQLLLRRANRAERHKKQLSHLHTKEAGHKAKLSKKEKTVKGSAKAEHKIKKVSAHSKEQTAKSAERLELRAKHRSARAEQDQKASVERQKHLHIRKEEAEKNIKGRLIHHEERVKMQADHFKSQAEEQAIKKAGADDHIFAIAQEEAVKAQAAAEEHAKKK